MLVWHCSRPNNHCTSTDSHTHLHTHTVTDPLASVRILTLPWQTYSGNRYKNLHLPSWAFNSFTNHLTLPSIFMPGHGPSRRNYQDQDKVYQNPSLFWISPTKTHHKNVKFNINNNKVGWVSFFFFFWAFLLLSCSYNIIYHCIHSYVSMLKIQLSPDHCGPCKTNKLLLLSI